MEHLLDVHRNVIFLLQVSWAINIKKNEVILKTYSIVDT